MSTKVIEELLYNLILKIGVTESYFLDFKILNVDFYSVYNYSGMVPLYIK